MGVGGGSFFSGIMQALLGFGCARPRLTKANMRDFVTFLREGFPFFLIVV